MASHIFRAPAVLLLQSMINRIPNFYGVIVIFREGDGSDDLSRHMTRDTSRFWVDRAYFAF